MTVKSRQCCEDSVRKLQMPTEFVLGVTGGNPPESLREFSGMRKFLQIALDESGACEHFCNQARIFLLHFSDETVRLYVQFADFLYMSVEDMEAMLDDALLDEEV